MSILMIGEREQAQIRAAIARARRQPLPLAMAAAIAAPDQNVSVLTLKNRRPGVQRPEAQMVLIPTSYRLAVSFEEQLAGMCLHISVSLLGERAKQALPHPLAVAQLARECSIPIEMDDDGGYRPLAGLTGWIEEFTDAGAYAGRAINLVYLVAPAPAGHA
jgi:hypothetical protein